MSGVFGYEDACGERERLGCQYSTCDGCPLKDEATISEPCPYCGGDNLEPAQWRKRSTWFVRCKDCAATGPSLGRSKAEAIRLFNTRKERKQGRLGI